MLHCLLHVKETMQTWGICTLDSSSHFESHCKEEINNCPLAILDVLQFLTYFTGQMPASTYASLKTNLIIKMTECQQSVSLPTRILKVLSAAPVVIRGRAIGSWCVTPADAGYKSGSSFASSPTTGTPSASTEGPQESTRWRLCCALLSLVCLLPIKGKLMETPHRYQGHLNGGPSLGGSLSEYWCECPFRGLVMWTAKSSHVPATENCSLHGLYTCCLWCLCHLDHPFIGSHACSVLLQNRRKITQLLD